MPKEADNAKDRVFDGSTLLEEFVAYLVGPSRRADSLAEPVALPRVWLPRVIAIAIEERRLNRARRSHYRARGAYP